VAQLSTLGDFTFMKTQRILGILWLALFTFIIAFWLWKFATRTNMSSDLGFHAFASPVYLFGVIASFFLIRGAQWARIAIGIIALLFAVLVFWLFWKSWSWHGVDGCLGIFALVSAVILLYPRRHEPVA
jgi:peptidoglycan/LPS O-acetylase OafA/YrhL